MNEKEVIEKLYTMSRLEANEDRETLESALQLIEEKNKTINEEYSLRCKFEKIAIIALKITGPVKIDEDSIYNLRNESVIEEKDYSCNSRIFGLK